MADSLRSILVFTLLLASYCYYLAIGDISVSTYTALFSISAYCAYIAVRNNSRLRVGLAYLLLATTPLLTVSGQIGTLTGFTRGGNGLPWMGISFVSLSIAYLIYKGKLDVKELILNVLQPLRFSSGPVVNRTIRQRMPCLTRVRGYVSWIILGAFFYSVLAAGLAPLLFLKTSTHSLDVLAFGVIFEIYVYLNFAGISFMVYGILNMVGVPVTANFKTPFASKDVMEYWRRWHLSFGLVLKEMIFSPLRRHIGLGLTVIAVFMMSAMWHGVTMNFMLWGLFHGVAWLISYQVAKVHWMRVGFLLNLILLPIVVVVGRIIFSESDELVLREKLVQLMHMDWSTSAYVRNVTLDIKTAVCLAAASLHISVEVFLPKISNRYKYLRRTLPMCLLLGAVIVYGSTGQEGVYGTR